MHYKRTKKHGSAEYRWGDRIVGRPCLHCDRPVVAREMCVRHYQMWHRHGDPLHSDKQKVAGLPSGEHMRRGYKMVTPSATAMRATPAVAATVERTSRSHAVAHAAKGLRDGTRRDRREWEHRKVAQARTGEIVHHIDGDPLNNDRSNLHVFTSPAAHATAHRSLERVSYSLLRAGLVEFDPASGCYRLVESVHQST
jgi:hypothetical protein